uniref:Tudor domain-containing protein n=1 Tax=Romanomermis culicivorax TaxID=13658 RepID=A0A915HS27_ROMCU
MECVLAPESAGPTKQQYISSCGEDFQSFGSKTTLSGLPPLYIPGKRGGFIDVVIDYIESTENFFCQLQDQGDEINKMSDDMAKFYSDNASGSKPLVNPLPGKLCAAKYSADNCWYRGFVLNRPRPAAFEIYFVDYGNTEMIYLTDLRTLSSDFSKYPPRAFRCALKNVPNNQCTIRKFKEKTEGQRLVLKLEDAEKNVFAVTLFDFDPKTKQEYNINEFLNVAIHSENSVGLANGQMLTNGNANKDEINHSYSAKIIQKDSCQPIDVLSNGEKLPTNVEPTRVEQTLPPINLVKNFPPFEVPLSNKADVFLPHAVDFNEFYLHLTSRSDDLVKMTTKLQDFCQRNAKNLPIDAVKLGSACATIFVEDGCFYRCVPIEIKHKLVKVHFVDYGNEQIVGIENLYELSDELVEQPRFCVKCRFNTLKYKDNDASDDQDIKNDFDSLAIDEKTNEPLIFECNFLSDEEPCLVSLQRSGKMLDDLLASMGHCEKIIDEKESPPSGSSTIVQSVAENFPHFRLPRSKTAEIYIPVAVTPGEFYVHLTSEAENLDRMTTELQKFCRKKARKLPKEKLVVGRACAAIYSSDGAFYRCTIMEVEDTSVDVYFVDYGNHDNVSIESLYELSDDFIGQPCFAAKCCVNSIKPTNGTENFDPSIKDDMDTLAIDSNGEAAKYSCEFLSDNEPYSVLLKSNSGENFEDLLTKMGQCKIVTEEEFENKFASANKIETFPHADWPTTMPICEVLISYDLGPDELYLQKFDTIDEFANFSERLQKFYKKCPKVEEGDVKIGSPYAAIFVDDGQFYRCVPVEILGNGNVKVEFVDYGNCQVMRASDLYVFPADDSGSEFLSTGRFVVKAHLVGVRPAKSAAAYGDEAVNFIDGYAITDDDSPKKFICKIDRSSAAENNQSYAVELIYEGKSLADVLIEKIE